MIVLLAAVTAFAFACLVHYHVSVYRALKQSRLETEELLRRIRTKESSWTVVWQNEESTAHQTWVEDIAVILTSSGLFFDEQRRAIEIALQQAHDRGVAFGVKRAHEDIEAEKSAS